MEMTEMTTTANGMTNDYGSSSYAQVMSEPYVQALHLKCSCRAELKWTDYDIGAALDYAQRWWGAHKECWASISAGAAAASSWWGRCSSARKLTPLVSAATNVRRS